MKTVIIVQARMTSTRLPGKVLKHVLGKPLLEYQIERLQRVKLADELVIATTTNTADMPIIDLCNTLNVLYFRSSEEDVLARYHGAATKHKADAVVRVTSDCPIIDSQIIDQVISFYIDHCQEYDYVANILERTYPRGMDTEIFSFSALERTYIETRHLPDREHVTPFITRHRERYRLANIAYKSNESRHRWTVDTPEDFELLKKIIETLYPCNPNFTLEDILNLLKSNPEWTIINAHIEQKNMDNNGIKIILNQFSHINNGL